MTSQRFFINISIFMHGFSFHSWHSPATVFATLQLLTYISLLFFISFLFFFFFIERHKRFSQLFYEAIRKRLPSLSNGWRLFFSSFYNNFKIKWHRYFTSIVLHLLPFHTFNNHNSL